MNNNHQDWAKIVLKKNRPKNVSEAKMRGYYTEIKKKDNTKYNKTNISNNKQEHRKLDEATDANKIKTYNKNIRLQIQKARLAKKMKQKDLANKVGINNKMIIDIENGKAKFNNRILQKIGKVLGVRFTNK